MGLRCSRSRSGHASWAGGTARARSDRQAMVGGEREVGMGTAQFMLGSEARCTDGVCGVMVRILIDHRERKVTHLMVEPAGRAIGSVGPLSLVDLDRSTPREVQLRCDVAAFEKLEPADAVGVAPDMGGSYFGYGGGMILPRAIVREVVPPGEKEVQEDETARANDGDIGHLHGLLADAGSHDVTALLFQVGHLWGRKVVAIPISAVIGFESDIPLSLSQQEVLDLPAFEMMDPDAAAMSGRSLIELRLAPAAW